MTSSFPVPATQGKGFERSTLDAVGKRRAFLLAQDGQGRRTWAGTTRRR